MANSNIRSHLCYKCLERVATLECCECDLAGLKLCYNCDSNIHEYSYKSTHLRSIIQKTYDIKLLYNNNTKGKREPLSCGINTPRVVQPPSKQPAIKDTRSRNNSVGSLKKQHSATTTTKTVNIDTMKQIKFKAPENNECNIPLNKYTRYQELIAKKDQVIESMKLSIDKLKQQLTNYNTTLIESKTQLETKRKECHDNIESMKSQCRNMEDARNRSTSNVCQTSRAKRSNSQDNTTYKQQIQASYDTYQAKFATLANEKTMQKESIAIIKQLLQQEQQDHCNSKKMLNNALKEIGSLRMLAKKKGINLKIN